MYVEVGNGKAKGVDKYGNSVTIELADGSHAVKKTASRWSICRWCLTQVTVSRVVSSGACLVAFTKCSCEGQYIPTVIKRGLAAGQLSEPFDSTHSFDFHTEQLYNRHVWANDCVIAYRSLRERRLVAFKWSSIKEGDYKPLCFDSLAEFEAENVADCFLSKFTISVLWQNGTFLLPDCAGELKGSPK